MQLCTHGIIIFSKLDFKKLKIYPKIKQFLSSEIFSFSFNKAMTLLVIKYFICK